MKNFTDGQVAVVDQVVDYWRSASMSAGVSFEEWFPASAVPVDPDASVDNPSSGWLIVNCSDAEISFCIRANDDGTFDRIDRNRGSLTVLSTYSDFVDAVKHLMLPLGEGYRFETGNKFITDNKKYCDLDGLELIELDSGRYCYRSVSNPGHFAVFSTRASILASLILKNTLGELCHIMRDSP